MFVADVLLRTSATFCQKTLVKLLHPLPSFLCGHEYQHGNAYYAYSKKNHCCSHFSLFAICIIIILTVIRRIAPTIPTTYIIHPASDSSSNADVMITKSFSLIPLLKLYNSVEFIHPLPPFLCRNHDYTSYPYQAQP